MSNCQDLLNMGPCHEEFTYIESPMFYTRIALDNIADPLGTASGDANEDGDVNILDIVIISNYVIGEGDLSGTAFNNSDMNRDGSVDILDIVLIANLILGG